MSNDIPQIVYRPKSNLGPKVIDVLHLPIVSVRLVVLHFSSGIYPCGAVPLPSKALYSIATY
jgi:hypothetical protein